MSTTIVIAIVILTGLGFYSVAKLRQYLYPPTPPMPAEVAMPMPEVLARLETTLSAKAPQVLESLQPGLLPEAIQKLEAQSGIVLPDGIKQLYQWRNGARPATNNVEEFFSLYTFAPLEVALAERESARQQLNSATLLQRAAASVFAKSRDSWLCIFSDGSGNGYFYDPNRKSTAGTVFYYYADEADFTFFPSVKNVLVGVAACYEQGAYKAKADRGSYEPAEDYEKAAAIWKEFGADR